MPRLFKKPSTEKNFFQNYSDHIDALEFKFGNRWNDFARHRPDLGEIMDFLGNEALARMNMFDSLKDGHDYFDEVVGATALPLLGMAASLAMLGKSIYEASVALLIQVGLANDDRKSHMGQAGVSLALAGFAFVASVASFLKSAISLITRPIITAINGYAPQDTDRFLREGKEEQAIKGFMNFVFG